MTYRVAIITVSDSVSSGQRADTSGDTAQHILESTGYEVLAREVTPDERQHIADTIRRFCGPEGADIVMTTGGTGLGPRDVTPEATMDVIDYVVPGIAEAMRIESMKKTPLAALSRQIVGVHRSVLIINLPGSPKAVKECLEVVLPLLPHAVQLLKGNTRHPEGTP